MKGDFMRENVTVYPTLPVGDIKKSIGFYCDKLGFTLVHHEDGFAVLMCNEVRIHLWEASDEGWRL